MKQRFVQAILLLLTTSLLLACLAVPYLNIFRLAHTKEVNVFVWGAFLSPKIIADFEHKTGVKVNLHIATSNEEMLAKIRSSEKGEFDLVFASDYAVEVLQREGRLQPIDHERIDAYSKITPLLLGHSFDPANQYSIPYAWEVHGIVQKYPQEAQPDSVSLKQLFHRSSDLGKIVMVPDPLEAFTMAAYYLYQTMQDLTPEQIEAVCSLLKQQREWVEAYADFRAKYLVVTGNCSTALVKSSFLLDLLHESSKEITFRLPKEGIFTTIENVVIPQSAKNKDHTYAFLNHIYQKNSYRENFLLCSSFPARLDAIEGSILDQKEIHTILEEILIRKDLVICRYTISPTELKEAWIDIKS